MAEFRVVVSDQVLVSGTQANKFIGKSIGDTIDGEAVGLPGYTLSITGGSDKDGFPARSDLPGARRHKIFTAGGTGYSPVHAGRRKRKLLRGREISQDSLQINTKIKDYGAKPVEELITPAKKEEKPKEDTKQKKEKK